MWMYLTILNFVLQPTGKEIKYCENDYFYRNYHTTEQGGKWIGCFANFVINLPFHPSLYFNNLTWCENSNLIGLSTWSNIGYAWLVLWRRQLQIQIVPWNNRGIITFCCQKIKLERIYVYRFSFSCPWVMIFLYARQLSRKASGYIF